MRSRKRERMAIFVGMTSVLLLLAESAAAAVVYKLGSTQPIAGYLVREDDSQVVLRQTRADGGSAELTIPKAEIEELIHTVDSARLAALNPSAPQAYREYADELAEKKLDPEARDAALRLYVIAADLAGKLPERSGSDSNSVAQASLVRRGAMLGLIALARTPEEEARFRAAAYLADPRHDPRLLITASPLQSIATGADPLARQKLLEAVRHVRRGKGEIAARLVTRPEIAAELAAASSIVSAEDFQRICRVTELEDAQLAKLIQLELALLAALSPADSETTSVKALASSWSQLLGKPQPPLRPLDLAHLTEFDPSHSIFRGGMWIAP